MHSQTWHVVSFQARRMCWWSGGNRGARDTESLRVLAAHILMLVKVATGEEIKSARGWQTRWMHTVDHDHRPELVAVLIALVDDAPEVAAMYPRSVELANAIRVRADAASELARPEPPTFGATLFIMAVMGVLTGQRQPTHGRRRRRGRGEVPVDSDGRDEAMRRRVVEFARVLERAAAMYAATVRANMRLLGDPGIRINLAFSVDYMRLAVDIPL